MRDSKVYRYALCACAASAQSDERNKINNKKHERKTIFAMFADRASGRVEVMKI